VCLGATLDLILEIACYISFVVCITASIAGNLQLYRERRSLFIVKRSPLVLFGLNFALIALMCSFLAGYISRIYLPWHAHLVADCCFVLCFWLFLCFVLIKSWFIWFRQQFTFNTLQLRWQRLIADDEDFAHTQSWYLRQNHRWGNIWFLHKAFGAAHPLGGLLGMSAVIMYAIGDIQYWPLLTYAVPVSIDLCLLTFIVCRTSKLALYDDVFLINWEQRRTVRLLIAYVLNFNAYSSVIFFYGLATADRVTAPLFIAIIYAMHHTSTFAIRRRYWRRVEHQGVTLSVEDASKSQTTRESARTFTVESVESTSAQQNSNAQSAKQTITLRQVIGHEKSVHLLMEYLSVEYSMECLLSFIELSQWEMLAMRWIREHSNSNIESTASFLFMAFPSNIPTSSVITQTLQTPCADMRCKLKIMAHRLYEKYIREYSEFEINVNSRIRKHADRVLADVERLKRDDGVKVSEIVRLFEEARQEMHSFLSSSFGQFQRRREWSRVQSIFSSSMN